jgi:hypothetical protein
MNKSCTVLEEGTEEKSLDRYEMKGREVVSAEVF